MSPSLFGGSISSGRSFAAGASSAARTEGLPGCLSLMSSIGRPGTGPLKIRIISSISCGPSRVWKWPFCSGQTGAEQYKDQHARQRPSGPLEFWQLRSVAEATKERGLAVYWKVRSRAVRDKVIAAVGRQLEAQLGKRTDPVS